MSVLLGLVVCVFGFAGPAGAETWDHIHLTVSDTKAAADWYAEHFDGKVTKSGPFDAVLIGTNLIKFKGGEDIKGSHGSVVDRIAFSVDDIKAKAEALGKDGGTVAAENRRKPGFRYVTDPWGTKLELLTDEDLKGFHHVLIKTMRPQGTLEFYRDMFGGEIVNYKDAINSKCIRYDDMYLFVRRSVRSAEKQKGRSVDHLGWQFKDFNGAISKLKEAGVKFVVEPTKSGDHMIAFIESPNGVKIEIVEAAGG
jgi:catechol 2,3-dioxygenase-like lactoylglutathione lyase family enzyme